MINEPKYDEDVVNLGYLKRILGLKDTDSVAIIVTKNYGTAPNPPYSLNDTYMYDGKVYICIKARDIGEFNPDDWQLMADNSALGDYATNNKVDTAVGALNQKIESTATGINIEVAKKLNKSEFTHANIVLAINDNSSMVLINADKINLTATDILNLLANNSIDLSSKNITINSNNFNVDTNGNCTANSFNSNNATITNGSILLQDSNKNPKLTILYSGDNSRSGKLYSNALKFDHGNNVIEIANTLNAPRATFSNGTSQSFISCYNVTTPVLNQTSLKKDKKNFELFTGALEIVKDIDLYKYNLKSEKDGHKKHIGFVIGEGFKYSKEITSVDANGNETGVDNYSMTSLCLQAIKEQQDLINTLRKEIDELKRSK